MADKGLVLVTGCTGFVAGHVVQQLLQQGYKVRGTVRDLSNEKKRAHLGTHENLEFVKANLEGPAEEWDKAVAGCTGIIHVASPFPSTQPKHEDELIKPAVQGAKNVLEAAARTDTVKRVVLTSSVVAIAEGHKGVNLNEEHWSDEAKCDPYAKSKTLAEKAAWDFVKANPKLELVTICPAFILGPPLSTNDATSMSVPIRMLNKKDPGVAALHFGVIDVRDVAAAHILGLQDPDMNGNRVMLCQSCMWYKDIAVIIKETFQPLGYNIATGSIPKPFLWAFSKFDKQIASIYPRLGEELHFDNKKVVDWFAKHGKTLNPPQKFIVDMCNKVIELKMVQQKPKWQQWWKTQGGFQDQTPEKVVTTTSSSSNEKSPETEKEKEKAPEPAKEPEAKAETTQEEKKEEAKVEDKKEKEEEEPKPEEKKEEEPKQAEPEPEEKPQETEEKKEEEAAPADDKPAEGEQAPGEEDNSKA